MVSVTLDNRNGKKSAPRTTAPERDTSSNGPASSIYTIMAANIQQLITDGQYDELVTACEEQELAAANAGGGAGGAAGPAADQL